MQNNNYKKMILTIKTISYKGVPDFAGITARFDASGGSIGRASDNLLVLPDPESFVSRHHARIIFQNGQFVLEDCSTDGTYFLSKDLLLQQNALPLADGELLQMGEYELLATLSAAEVSAPFSEPVRQLDLVDSSANRFDGLMAASQPLIGTVASFIDQPDASAIHGSFIPPKVEVAPVGTPARSDEADWDLDNWFKDDQPSLSPLGNAANASDDLSWLPEGIFEQDVLASEPPDYVPAGQADDLGFECASPLEPLPFGDPDPAVLPVAPDIPAGDLDSGGITPSSDFPPLPVMEGLGDSPLLPADVRLNTPVLLIKVVSYKGGYDNLPVPVSFDGQGGEIGRAAGNHLVLPDPEKIVSGRHARISFEQGQFILEDCSTNGTLLGPKKLLLRHDRLPLTDGIRLWMGEYELQALSSSAGAIPSCDSANVGADNAQPLQVSTPASPVDALVVDNGLLQAFWSGLGVAGEHAASPQQSLAMMRASGELLRHLVEGLMQVLRVRAELKSQFRVSLTTMQAHENNPLKFAADVDEALGLLLQSGHAGFLGPQAAVCEGFNDLVNHQMAMMAGIQAALADTLKKFDPDAIAKAQADALLQKKSKCWESYTEKYPQLTASAQEQFFGEVFADAYEKQMQLLVNRNP